MQTFFIVVAILAALNAVRLIRNKAKAANRQAELNYERYLSERRIEANSSLGFRAGKRRADEHAWSRGE